MAKYKACPKCGHKNSWLSDKCDSCNASIMNVDVRESFDNLSSGKSYGANPDLRFASFLSFISYIMLFAGLIGCIVVFVVNSSPIGIFTAISLLLSGVMFYGIINALARLLRK